MNSGQKYHSLLQKKPAISTRGGCFVFNHRQELMDSRTSVQFIGFHRGTFHHGTRGFSTGFRPRWIWKRSRSHWWLACPRQTLPVYTQPIYSVIVDIYIYFWLQVDSEKNWRLCWVKHCAIMIVFFCTFKIVVFPLKAVEACWTFVKIILLWPYVRGHLVGYFAQKNAGWSGGMPKGHDGVALFGTCQSMHATKRLAWCP